MNEGLMLYLKKRLKVNNLQPSIISGGSINSTYRIDTDNGTLFLKYNDAYKFPGMFERESDGLNILGKTNSICVPKVYEYGENEGLSFLLLEWISTDHNYDSFFWKNLGKQLAQLHRNTRPNFGLSHSNYIGSLDQYNNNQDSSSDFLIYERLEPQLFLAEKNDLISGQDRNDFEKLYLKLPEIIPNEFPSLIHGDLWSGNWMKNQEGQPILIDPAVSYSIREMDLAMMKLFGQPDSSFYEVYHYYFPLEKNWKSRISVYQLYYLMVHLNLFGNSYLNAVRQILKNYI